MIMGDGQFKPGVAAIIIIAIGILILTLLFIFGKRQIMRFAQKFPIDGAPHAPIGHCAPKNVCSKIEARLNAIKNIFHEPVLMNPSNKYACEENASAYKHIYRMKTVDLLKDFEDYIMTAYGKGEAKRRAPGEDVRSFLLKLQKDINGPMIKCDINVINQLVDIYLHARFDAEPDFGHENLKQFQALIEGLKSQIIPV